MDWPRFARAADAVVVAVLVVYGQATVWTADAAAVAQHRPVHAILIAAASVPLFVRRYRPLLALLLCVGAGWLHAQFGGESGVVWFGFCLGLYALGAHADQWSLLAGCGVATATVLWYDVPRLMAGAAVDEVLPAWFILAGLVGLGRWMRHRHRETEQLQARAVRTEQEIAEETARAVADDGVRDRVQAVIVAFRAGIVPVDPGRTA